MIQFPAVEIWTNLLKQVVAITRWSLEEVWLYCIYPWAALTSSKRVNKGISIWEDIVFGFGTPCRLGTRWSQKMSSIRWYLWACPVVQPLSCHPVLSQCLPSDLQNTMRNIKYQHNTLPISTSFTLLGRAELSNTYRGLPHWLSQSTHCPTSAQG